MNLLKHILKFGLLVFILGGCIDAEPGAKFEWVPYVFMAIGLAMTLGYVFIESQFYTGD